MSALQREAMKNARPPLPNQFKPSSSSSTAAGGQSRFAGLVPKRKKKDYASVAWSEYFQSEKDVCIGENQFHMYTLGCSGPVILLLHGAGHSALSWAIFAKTIHSLCECQVVAIDFRGHGSSSSTDDLNMDASVMASDVSEALRLHYNDDIPPAVMLGHSMGGAIGVHIAVGKLIPSLKGLAVIDVVEGTALEALPTMQSFLRSRPSQFRTLEGAIEWSVRSGQLRNVDSAKVSMLGQLKRVAGSNAQCMTPPQSLPTASTRLSSSSMPDISEDDAETNTQEQVNRSLAHTSIAGDVYEWRVDLSKTEPHWEGWFKNMSSLFLSCNVPKLLILAGVDRLDKELTIGQMQGKFQMQILANCGHMVHEDVPDKVADIVTTFLLRQKLTQSKSDFKRTMPEC